MGQDILVFCLVCFVQSSSCLVVFAGEMEKSLMPGLTSTLTSALNSSPFPSPLGATNPPAGRYEGSILGIAALGPHAVRTAVWGNNGDGLPRIDLLVSKLYPGEREGKKGKSGLMKATQVGHSVTCAPYTKLHTYTSPARHISRFNEAHQ